MRRVLVVDDAAFMRMSIKLMLEKGEYKVIGEASNGEEGVKLYKELMPDLVTMDITMPIKSGLDALKDIIAYDSKAKVIMVSAMGQELMVREAILRVAKNFIVKPFKEESIISMFNKI